MTDDRSEDVPVVELLSRAMSAEAQQVQPAGDGLSRIQQRVNARQSRLRWIRPVMAGAAAVVIVGGAVGGYAIATQSSGKAIVKIGPADGGPLTTPPVAAGDSFYGVENERVARIDGQTGAVLGYITDRADVTEAHRVGDTVYFATGSASCQGYINSVSTSGGGVYTAVATADPGYEISGFDVSVDATKLAYFESGCGANAGKGMLVFTDLTAGTVNKINFPSEPPLILGDPVWESDGVHVDAFVRNGMQGELGRYDATAEGQGSDEPSTGACTAYQPPGGMANAITATAPDGTLWFANQTGTSMQVVSCADDQPTIEFSTPENDTPQSLSVNSTGDVLLVGTSGRVWTWSGAGKAEDLTGASGVSSVAW